MSRFIQCPDCHGVALVIYGEGEAGCGTYDKLHVNTTDAALEKHLPVVKVKKDWRDSDFLIKNFGYREEE